uniref:Lipocalin n=1 Tax=Rhipicephalus zambeziensis TaxID=60191 RepID=A0A224YHN1_9ACAR
MPLSRVQFLFFLFLTRFLVFSYPSQVDCDLQTDDSTEADLSTFPKIDCEVQTDDTGDNEIVSKLAGTQLKVNRLNVSLRRLVFEKIGLEESRKKHWTTWSTFHP